LALQPTVFSVERFQLVRDRAFLCRKPSHRGSRYRG
jgi:hypothetical protein